MALPFHPFKPIVKKIDKIVGAPSRTIAKWCREKTKTITPNALKPSSKKTTKDKKINEIIDNIGLVPELEEKVYNLEKQVIQLELKHDKEVKELQDMIATNTMGDVAEAIDTKKQIATASSKLTKQHQRHKHQFGPTVVTPTTPPAVIRTYTKKPRKGFYEGGGRTKPKPLTQSQRKKLIDDILKGS